jgi:hypothetical protein
METRYDGKQSKVCATGRVSRVLDSLTKMDASEQIAAPVKTTEILRNEIFDKSSHILQEQLKLVPKDVAEAYNSSAADPTTEMQVQLDQFRTTTKNKIAETIRNDYAGIPITGLDSIIKDAQAGVDI